jgi:hypothetical protein
MRIAILVSTKRGFVHMGSVSDRHTKIPERRPYRSPTLERYGNINALTQAVVSSGMGDGTPGGVLKT